MLSSIVVSAERPFAAKEAETAALIFKALGDPTRGPDQIMGPARLRG
ncbi:hypothetical protein [Streptomyces sp. NPDC002547]